MHLVLCWLSAILAMATRVWAHMSMIGPCPRYNSQGINCPALPPGEAIDYNESSPISSSGVALQPFCKYATPWPTPAAQWTAGQSITVNFSNYGSEHNGGHAEFSLSYDAGKSFVVIYRVLSHFFYDAQGNYQFNYTFALPASVPGSDSAIFAWSWVNSMGNREFYMNCADVAISGTSESFSGPQMTVLNYPGYPTVPEFQGNYTIGVEYYNSAPTITVYAPASQATLTATSATTMTMPADPPQSSPPSTVT
ncbi:hypothetical protein GGF42_008797 [Coemansia sp. RSA 2424]|nr:hypothetical protein GGF42_008797 [Coemansia sp. RSA 2424]